MYNHKKIRKAHLAFRAQPASNDPSLKSTPGSSAANPKVPGPSMIVEIDFRELADGTLLEMIQDPNDPTKSLLAVSKNGQVHLAEKFELGNQVLVPLPRNGAILRDLRLADGLETLEPARDLLSRIISFLSYTVELTCQQIIALSCFVLDTWIIEKLPCAPYVALI